MIKNVILTAGILAVGFTASPAPGQDASDGTHSFDANDQCYYTSACYSVMVGSPEIDPARLVPYHAIWTQTSPGEDGKWAKTPGSFEEILSVGEEGNWKHVQIIRNRNGGIGTGTRILDHSTLQILNLTLEFENGPPGQPEKVYYDMTGDSFAADVTFPDGSNRTGQPRDLAMPMFDGQIGGVALAALPLKKGYVATLPMVIPNLGIYWIEASVIDRKEIPTADGGAVDVWEVTAKWLNLTDGDIYEPGRDGSGGVYYIAVHPGDGVPPVIEYVNDGAIIAWDGVRRTQ